MIPATSMADRAHAQLVVIDIQDRLSRAMERREQVVARTGLLLSVASIVGLPVTLTRQYPQGLGDFDGLLAERLSAPEAEAYRRIDKLSFDCFGEPGFCQAVTDAERPQLIVCGMESHICVSQTVLSALREGLDVHVVADACCSRHDEAHQIALMRLSSAGAVVTTAESVAYELVGKAGTAEFKQLLAAVKG